MAEYFDYQQLIELVKAAESSGVMEPEKRKFLFGGMPSVRLAINSDPNPKTQLQLDLQDLRTRNPLPSGRLPIVMWLEQAIILSVDMAEQEIFRRVLARVAPGEPAGPPVDCQPDLPEFKEAVAFRNTMVAYSFLEGGYQAGQSVAKLTVPRFESGNFTNRGYFGTGWMLTADLLITCHHVINARDENQPAANAPDFEEQALRSLVEFDYVSDSAATPKAKVTALELFDATLDFALLRIDTPPGRPPLRRYPGRIEIRERKGVRDYVPLNIIQHPKGDPKKIAIRNNLGTGSTGTKLRYLTDTLEGSSGSPVFDDEWRVGALHTGSQAAKIPFQGLQASVVNVGTQVQAILEWIRMNDAAFYAANGLGV